MQRRFRSSNAQRTPSHAAAVADDRARSVPAGAHGGSNHTQGCEILEYFHVVTAESILIQQHSCSDAVEVPESQFTVRLCTRLLLLHSKFSVRFRCRRRLCLERNRPAEAPLTPPSLGENITSKLEPAAPRPSSGQSVPQDDDFRRRPSRRQEPKAYYGPSLLPTTVSLSAIDFTSLLDPRARERAEHRYHHFLQ